VADLIFSLADLFFSPTDLFLFVGGCLFPGEAIASKHSGTLDEANRAECDDSGKRPQ